MKNKKNPIIVKKIKIDSKKYIKIYMKRGKIIKEETYLSGKRHGLVKEFSPNGNIIKLSHYKNGLKDGLEHGGYYSSWNFKKINWSKGKMLSLIHASDFGPAYEIQVKKNGEIETIVTPKNFWALRRQNSAKLRLNKSNNRYLVYMNGLHELVFFDKKKQSKKIKSFDFEIIDFDVNRKFPVVHLMTGKGNSDSISDFSPKSYIYDLRSDKLFKITSNICFSDLNYRIWTDDGLYICLSYQKHIDITKTKYLLEFLNNEIQIKKITRITGLEKDRKPPYISLMRWIDSHYALYKFTKSPYVAFGIYDLKKEKNFYIKTFDAWGSCFEKLPEVDDYYLAMPVFNEFLKKKKDGTLIEISKDFYKDWDKITKENRRSEYDEDKDLSDDLE